MIPKRIYMNRRTAEIVGENGDVTTRTRTAPNKYHDEVEFTALSEVWHDVSEPPNLPKDSANIVARVESNKIELRLMTIYPKTNWESISHYWCNVLEWAYVKDLLPFRNEKIGVVKN